MTKDREDVVHCGMNIQTLVKKAAKFPWAKLFVLLALAPFPGMALLTTTPATIANQAPAGGASFSQPTTPLAQPSATVALPTGTTTFERQLPSTTPANQALLAQTPTPEQAQAQTAPEPVQAKVKPKGSVEEENVIETADPVTYNQIRDLMIYESNISNGECPCPYSPDRIGGQCGNESKYYKPHSHRIYCYPEDITRREVYFYWLDRGVP